MRAVRAFARGKDIEYGFGLDSSKKCAYCTLLNEKCRPVPLYVGREYEELVAALDRRSAAQGEDGGNVEEAAAEVRSVAFRLATTVQVATAQVKDLSGTDVLLASHYSLQEEVRGLKEQVSELTAAVAALTSVMALGASGPGDQSKGTGTGRDRKGGRPGAAPVSADGGLGSGPMANSDSELSLAPADMELS